MNRNRRMARLALAGTGLGLALIASVAPGARAQCDPDATWSVYQPTGDVAEVLVTGNRAWIAALGGVIRIDLDGITGANPLQIKITDNQGLVSTEVTCLAEDSYGNIWVGTRESGLSVFRPDGTLIRTLTSFSELWSDRVVAIGGRGNRMFVVSVDSFSASGTLEGGGFVIIQVNPDGSGGFTFTPFQGTDLEVGQVVVDTPGGVWFGTSGQGLWVRDESTVPPTFRQELLTELASANVENILVADHFDQSGRDVLWLGTGAGLHTYDPATAQLDTIPDFFGENILDVFHEPTTNTLYVARDSSGVRDVFTIDLDSPFFPVRVPRSTCFSDTLYVPRDIGADAQGRMVLGTRAEGFSVYQSPAWHCPPPLGPHAPQAADLHVAADGTLYFGTGDKERLNGRWNGVGVFDGSSWKSITRDDGILESNMTEVHIWRDGTVWFGSSTSAAQGGLNRYFPDTGAIEAYHNATVNTARRTLGRHVRQIREDPDGNLWVLYGQADPAGGLSVIEPPPSLQIKNYDFSLLFAGTTLLRAFDFDSRGRIWVCTHDTVAGPAQLYVIDPRGTLFNLTDDVTAVFNMANQVFNLGECKALEIDSRDRIWIAGNAGLAVGQIDAGGGIFASWTRVVPDASQTGGRNPLPYRVAALDWNEDLWLGTESAGLVRVSRDASDWTWYDELQGCPLPDQSVAGIFPDASSRSIWVGTSLGGIARIDLSGSSGRSDGDTIEAEPYPNPWNPDTDGPLTFGGIPTSASVTLRIFTAAGEIVLEESDVRGTKSWNGNNLGGFVVESGVYFVRATASTGQVYETKVAVLR